jgi:transcriptional regulator with XRE-family HTH domain
MSPREKERAREPPEEMDDDDSFEQFLAQVGERVKEIRTMQGLTKIVAGEFTGVGAPQLSRIEQGRINMTLRLVHRIAGALGVPPHELLVPREQSGVIPRAAKKKKRKTARKA